MAFLAKGQVCTQVGCFGVLRVTGHPEVTWFMSADTFPTEVPTCADKLGHMSRGGFPPRVAVTLLMDWRQSQPCGAQSKVTCEDDIYQEA